MFVSASPGPAGPRPGPNDAQLARTMTAGSHDALAELYRRHGPAVWGLCSRICRDTEVARDVCQTVFCDLWAGAPCYDAGRGTFRAWLLAQAHARSVDAVRSEVARRRREQRVASLAETGTVDVEALALLGSLRESVRRAVAQLPEAERDAILLTYLGGHTYREAARLLGQPEGTVKSRIRTGLHRLRAALGDPEVTR